MRIDFSNIFILNALKLPIITSLESLSNNMALSTRLIYLLSKETERFYKEFSLKKRDGSERIIARPSYSMKVVQRWILREIFEKLPVSENSYAFRKGHNFGVKKNAEIHKNSLFILELDLKNFFPSIKRVRVFRLFKDVGYNNIVSNILANLCTLKDVLPQGGVCSPYISNLICEKLDKRLRGLCSKRDIIYTRYADDLTFSCDNKNTLIKTNLLINEIVLSEGFEINTRKTRLLSPSSKKTITGITVNDGKIKAPKDLKKLVRAMIHRAIITGDYNQNEKIRGYISFINYIEKGYKEKIIEYLKKLTIKEDFCLFEDIVKEYNSHKLYKFLEDMRDMSSIGDIVSGLDEEEDIFGDTMEDKLFKRGEYLKRLKVKSIKNFSKKGNLKQIQPRVPPTIVKN